MTRIFSRITAPGVFVAVIWLGMTAAAVFYVAQFASPYPFGDEWDLVPGTIGQEPMGRWLWAQHNEHRLPLPKLVYSGLLSITHHDARAGGMATVATLALLSLAFMATARRLRGHTEYADAFFPIALLNWGHFENYLIGFQINFALSVAIACIWFLGAMRISDHEHEQGTDLERNSVCGSGTRQSSDLPPVESLGDFHYKEVNYSRGGVQPSGRGSFVCAATLPLLPLCGAHGLAYVLPLGLATLLLTRRETTLNRIAAFLGVALSFAMVGFYFLNYRQPVNHPVSAGIHPSLFTALEMLALGWGWVAQMTWPLSGFFTMAFFAACLVLAIALRRYRDERDGFVAWLALAAGTFTLALGIGWGRSGFGPLAGFADRYSLLAFPAVGAAFLVWVRYGGQVFGSLVPMTMLLVACLFLTQHTRTGLSEGKINSARMQAFGDDLQAGLPPEELAKRHPDLFPHSERFADRLRMLRKSGIARYRAMGADAVARN